ncbi:MAG: hypothetical protein HONBIEJF_02549 [Fimbriimonadaceae bacterium]|nr:hypothetical protein [Fimbriimonadaceae bacterium]
MRTDFQGRGFGTTPFPDWLLDKLMPRLRDVEWRLICVLVRQTLGWQTGDGKRKHSDWLSHSQLRRRTGRSSSAISPAIDFLCRNRLIEVEDGQGQPLRTAFERRRHRGRLFFRVNLERLRFKQKRLRLIKRIHIAGTTRNTITKEAVVRATKTNTDSSIQKSESIKRQWQHLGKSLKGRRDRTNPRQAQPNLGFKRTGGSENVDESPEQTF